MTRVKQQFKHNPPETYGDCHRASLASLLELPLEEVPHFMQGLSAGEGEVFNKLQEDWLYSRNLDCVVFPICTDSLDTVFVAAKAWNPDRLFILGGESMNGCGHSVIASPAGIEWDPSIDGSGIVGPMSDGFYWITYIMGKLGSNYNLPPK